jgi:pyruvate/2-oxoglutarate dehydrogenase complex dihydrolipoamide acyltransferase (E2) component
MLRTSHRCRRRGLGPGGLITPIIRDACHKSLSQISNEMKDHGEPAPKPAS